MWQAIVAGGLSALGGLFARKDAKDTERRAREEADRVEAINRASVDATNATNLQLGKSLLKEKYKTHQLNRTTEVNTVDVDAMVKAAEKAGFNPASFLAAGGASLFTRREATEDVLFSSLGHNAAQAYQLMSPQTYQAAPRPTYNVPSLGSVFASGLSDAYKTYASEADRVRDQDFRRELLNLQLSAVQAGKRQGKGASSFTVPSMVTSGGLDSPVSGGALSKSKLGKVGSPKTPEAGDATVTNPFDKRNVEPSSRDASLWEDRYGEVLGMVGGIKNAWDDGFRNLTGMTSAERYRAYGQPFMTWLNKPVFDLKGADKLKSYGEPSAAW